jgi:tetratricopeptide (TPR) repeat protein
MGRRPRGFIAFRSAQDAENYCQSDSESAKEDVRALWDSGQALYMTELADFEVLDTFPNKPYIKIRTETIEGALYLSAAIAQRLRFRRVPQSGYTAEDWLEAAFSACRSNELDKAQALFNEAYHAAGASPNQIAQAMLSRAALLEALNQIPEALNLLTEIEQRYVDAADSAVRDCAAEAMCEKGAVLARQGRHHEALVAFDATIARFIHDRDPRIREQSLIALARKEAEFCTLQRVDEAVEVIDELASLLPDTMQRGVLKHRALGFRLQRIGRALQTCDDAIARFQKAADLELVYLVAGQMCRKADALKKFGHPEEALRTYEDIVRQYATNTELMRRVVEDAKEKISRLRDNPSSRVVWYETELFRRSDDTI